MIFRIRTFLPLFPYIIILICWYISIPIFTLIAVTFFDPRWMQFPIWIQFPLSRPYFHVHHVEASSFPSSFREKIPREGNQIFYARTARNRIIQLERFESKDFGGFFSGFWFWRTAIVGVNQVSPQFRQRKTHIGTLRMWLFIHHFWVTY